MTTGPGTNSEFGEWAQRSAKGRSLRELSRATGISHTRISDMQFGVVPSFRLLTRYCEVLELSSAERLEGFAAAGYIPRTEPPTVDQAADLFLDTLERERDQGQKMSWDPELRNVRAEGIEGLVSDHDVETGNDAIRLIIKQMAERQGRD